MSLLRTEHGDEVRSRAGSGGEGHEPVAFADLVRLHHRWRKSVEDTDPTRAEDRRRHSEDYHAALHAFEAEHGRIVNAYWCSEVESAVALTERPCSDIRARLATSPLRFHRVSDWATKDDPEIARCLHDCDELAIRAAEVLRGRSQRICMQLVMATAGHLLSLVDAPAAPKRDTDRRKAIVEEQRELAETERYYREAANGEAQLVYFAGVALGFLGLGLVLGLGGWVLYLAGVDYNEIVIGCLIAGALGAVVSVIARINTGSFALSFDIARGYTLFLGSLRPALGAIFGLTLYFAVDSGFLDVFNVPMDDSVDRFYFLCVISFLAGFSERWAQDTLTGGITRPGGKMPRRPPVRRSRTLDDADM